MLSTQAGRCHENADAGKCLFRRKVPCSGRGNCLFGAEQGIVRSTLELQYKWTPESAESAQMAGDFQHFPALRECTRPQPDMTPATLYQLR